MPNQWVSFIFAYVNNSVEIEKKDLNRIKVMLAEKKKASKWLAEQLGKDPATVSR
ncbi:hypothetical protein BANORC5_19750 [Bacteroides nordii]|nr:helix-turn-helix domain-containing protein [Bacteroides nordii]GFZ39940.1 hypothetical protein BANORC5_19750 [Bacteroides nordii]